MLNLGNTQLSILDLDCCNVHCCNSFQKLYPNVYMELWSKTIISVLDGSVMVKQSDMEIKNETSYLCIGSEEITSSPSQKVVKLCTTSPPLSVINTMLSLSKLPATLIFLSRVSYRDIFSVKVLLCCHVPGCHESALLDTVSRSRCEPHASNPKLRSAYYIPNHLTLNWNHVSHSSKWCLKRKSVLFFARKQTWQYGVILL